MGASAWSPCSLEPHHTDLYWYGVHGVETLYTAMGMGCKHVTRVHTDDTDLVVGQWDGGRVGVFRGIRRVRLAMVWSFLEKAKFTWEESTKDMPPW